MELKDRLTNAIGSLLVTAHNPERADPTRAARLALELHDLSDEMLLTRQAELLRDAGALVGRLATARSKSARSPQPRGVVKTQAPRSRPTRTPEVAYAVPSSRGEEEIAAQTADENRLLADQQTRGEAQRAAEVALDRAERLLAEQAEADESSRWRRR